MKKYPLNGLWHMEGAGYACDGTVPGSVYSFLLGNGLMEDPYYRDNEDKALALMEHDFHYCRTFSVDAPMLEIDAVLLHCDGLDTFAAVSVAFFAPLLSVLTTNALPTEASL